MRSNRGTTLVELLISMGIMGIVLFLAARLVTFSYEFYRYTDESITLQKEGLMALQFLTQDLLATHQRSVVITPATVTTPAPDHREDQLVIPLPHRIDGETEVNEEGAAKWMSVAGYEIDTARPTRNLMRYLGDTVNDVGGDFTVPPPDNYIADIETVLAADMPTLPEIIAYPAADLRIHSVCRHVLEFQAHKNVDTVVIDLTVLLPGRVRGGVPFDNSLSLNTTVFPRN